MQSFQSVPLYSSQTKPQNVFDTITASLAKTSLALLAVRNAAMPLMENADRTYLASLPLRIQKSRQIPIPCLKGVEGEDLGK